MPIIPRANPNLPQLNNLPNARNQTEVRAFTGVAAAVGGITQQIQGIFEKQQQRQDEASVFEVENKLHEWGNKWRDPNNPDGLSKYKGADALGLPEKVNPDYQQYTSGLMTGLKSDNARQAASRMITKYKLGFDDQINRYATEENERYIGEQRTSALNINQQEAALAVTEKRYEAANDAMDKSEALIRLQARDQGWPPEKVQEAIFNQQSSIHSTVTNSMFDNGEYAEGVEYYNANIKEVSIADRARLDRVVRMANIETTLAGDVADGGTAQAGYSHYFDSQIGAESNHKQFDAKGNPLISSAGAVGAGQVLPTTGPEAAKLAGLPWDKDKLYNDEKYNLALAAAYSKEKFREFGNNPVLAIAAYNAGAGNVRKLIAKIGDPRKGEVTNEEFIARLPAEFKETKDYVTKIIKNAGPQREGMSARDNALTVKDLDYRKALIARQDQNEARQERAQRDAERDQEEHVYGLLDQADPGMLVKDAIGSSEYLRLSGKQRMELDNYQDRRLSGTQSRTDPRVLDSYLVMSDAEFIKSSPMNDFRAGRLSASNSQTLEDRRQALLDPKKSAKASAEAGTESNVMAMAFQDLGLSSKDYDAPKRGEFVRAFWEERDAFVLREKRKPSYEEMKAMAKKLQLPFVKQTENYITLGMFDKTRDSVPYKRYEIKPADRETYSHAPKEKNAAIIAYIKKNNPKIVSPTQAMIDKVYADIGEQL